MKKIFLTILLLMTSLQFILTDQDILNGVVNGNVDLVNSLLQKNPELIKTKDQWGNDLLARSIWKGNPKMAACLISHGIDIKNTEPDSNPLHIAVNSNEMEIVELLIHNGSNVNRKNSKGKTSLDLAVDKYNKTLSYYLLDKGGVFGETDSNPERILISMLRGSMDRLLLPFLKKNKIDYKYQTDHQHTLLHAAGQGGLSGFCQKLLDRGLKIDAQTRDGWTPLHFVIKSGDIQTIELLIKKGADSSLRTLDGRTAYNIAQEIKQTPVLDCLKRLQVNQSPLRFPEISAKYIDSDLPSKRPKLFARGIISKTQTFEHNALSFSQDLNMVCWTDWQREGVSKIFTMEKKSGVWGKQKVVVQNASSGYISPSGKRIYFTQRRILPNGKKAYDNDLFYVERIGDEWGKPINPGPNVNTINQEGKVCVTADYTIYFIYAKDIYRSRWKNGQHCLKEKLPSPINTTGTENAPFVSVDENFIIYRSFGRGEFQKPNVYISFRGKKGQWSIPINLSKELGFQGLFFSVSPDEKYFFIWNQDYYWSDFKILEQLRKKAIKTY